MMSKLSTFRLVLTSLIISEFSLYFGYGDNTTAITSYTQIGENFTYIIDVPNPQNLSLQLAQCKFKEKRVPYFNWVRNENDNDLSQVVNKSERYEYFANPSNGDCGININNVSEVDFREGDWSFFYIYTIGSKNNPKSIDNYLKLAKAVMPDAPSISKKESVPIGGVIENLNTTFICCANNGVPQPQLKFTLDGIELKSRNLGNSSTKTEDEFCIEKKLIFKRKDNGKQLKCLMSHLTTDKLNNSSLNEAIFNLTVLFPPSLLETDGDFNSKVPFVIRLNNEMEKVNFKFTGNPEPEIKFIYENEYEPKTNFTPIITNENIFMWDWEIMLNKEDYYKNHTFLITMKNEIGELTFNLSIIALNKQAIEKTTLSNKKTPYIDETLLKNSKIFQVVESGFSLNWLYILLSIIGLLILISIVMLFIARKNAWFWWKHRRGEYDTIRRKKKQNSIEETDKDKSSSNDSNSTVESL